MRILVVSSLPLEWCSGLAHRLIMRYRHEGNEVDFFTSFEPEENQSWIYFVNEKKTATTQTSEPLVVQKTTCHNLLTKAKTHIRSTAYRILKTFDKKLEIPPLFSVVDDRKPGVPIQRFKTALPDKQYDFIITLFWWGMITPLTIQTLFEKYNCEILVSGIDMSAMTGGCHYFGDCRGYMHECRNCPKTRHRSFHDLPHQNFLLRRQIYSNPKIKFGGNKWMLQHFKSCGLFTDEQLVLKGGSVDTDLFCPKDQGKLRQRYDIPEGKFVFFAGATNPKEPRKGFKYLQKAFSKFAKNHRIEASQCLLLFAGKSPLEDSVKSKIGIETKYIGYLTPAELADVYALADVYVSPSLDDAGPLMVNQAICCGTPVLAFSLGTALEVVITGETGHLAKERDIDDFADGLYYLYQHGPSLRKQCRDFALQNFHNNPCYYPSSL